jgi:hypothetical protein
VAKLVFNFTVFNGNQWLIVFFKTTWHWQFFSVIWLLSITPRACWPIYWKLVLINTYFILQLNVSHISFLQVYWPNFCSISLHLHFSHFHAHLILLDLIALTIIRLRRQNMKLLSAVFPTFLLLRSSLIERGPHQKPCLTNNIVHYNIACQSK